MLRKNKTFSKVRNIHNHVTCSYCTHSMAVYFEMYNDYLFLCVFVFFSVNQTCTTHNEVQVWTDYLHKTSKTFFQTHYKNYFDKICSTEYVSFFIWFVVFLSTYFITMIYKHHFVRVSVKLKHFWPFIAKYGRTTLGNWVKKR